MSSHHPKSKHQLPDLPSSSTLESPILIPKREALKKLIDYGKFH
jgi:hypothetical protein